MSTHFTNQSDEVNKYPTVCWDNLFNKGSVAVGGTPTNYPVSNAFYYDTVTFWKPASLPTTTYLTLPEATTADSLCIAGHNLGSKGSTVNLSRSDDGSSWTSVIEFSPSDDTTTMALFSQVSSKYWSLTVTGSQAPTITTILLGDRFNFPAGIKAPYTPVWLSQTYDLIVPRTMGGQFTGSRVKKLGGETKISLVSVSRDFAENDLLPFREHYNLGLGFFFAAGPSIFTRDVGYVWRKENSTMNPSFDQAGSWLGLEMDVHCYGK